MNYADIKCNDAANGPGVRISLFVSGCTHHCKGCFNEVTWDFNYGNPFTQKEIDMIIKDLEPPYISGLTILGGEPMEPANQPGILPLIRKVREVYGSFLDLPYHFICILHRKKEVFDVNLNDHFHAWLHSLGENPMQEAWTSHTLLSPEFL